MAIESKLQNFIHEHYLFTGDQSALSNDDSFNDKGIIDLTGIFKSLFSI